jgi:hypothetical protein
MAVALEENAPSIRRPLKGGRLCDDSALQRAEIRSDEIASDP